ncbi:acyltransferase [Streptomyces sp. NBC_00289]|uniref:acyltransferase family protein n=1 Tax=Streptomyces sp. NBC_00289 TaxID=2975703 RepID=UPI00325620CE
MSAIPPVDPFPTARIPLQKATDVTAPTTPSGPPTTPAGPAGTAAGPAGTDATAEPEQTARTAQPAEQTRRAPVRDLYFDLLRAIALFRVVFYHLMGWAWLPVVFPSMGVMFALAGNLMARSLKRRPPIEVIRGRMRRLLPPLWLLGAIGVTGMLLQGWGPDAEGHPGWWWLHLTFWILPLSEPPAADSLAGIHGLIGGDWASELAVPLWYIRAYLWFVLLSPVLLKALRALPWATILAPIALCATLEFGYLTIPYSRIDSAAVDFATFGACWILGMAHQEGILKRIPRYAVPSVAPAVALLGLWYALTHGFKAGHDLDDIPFGQALWSVSTVLLLLHFSPSWSEWPRRLRRWDKLVTLLNSRAVTVYLWHNVCIVAAATMWDQLWGFEVLELHAPWLLESSWPVLLLTWILVAGCILCFGWMEDVAAKRKPRLWPAGGAGRGRAGAHRA